MQFEVAPQRTKDQVWLAVDDPPDSGVDECHCAHGTRLLHHVTVVPCAKVGPAIRAGVRSRKFKF